MSSYYLQDSGSVYWQLGASIDGREQNTVVGSQSIVTLVLADTAGGCWQLGITTDGRLTTTSVAPTTAATIILYDSTSVAWELRVGTDGRLLLECNLWALYLNRNVGIFSKDASLYGGSFDVGIPIRYGLYDDDFVAQFSGTTRCATAGSVVGASIPLGVFDRDVQVSPLGMYGAA